MLQCQRGHLDPESSSQRQGCRFSSPPQTTDDSSSNAPLTAVKFSQLTRNLFTIMTSKGPQLFQAHSVRRAEQEKYWAEVHRQEERSFDLGSSCSGPGVCRQVHTPARGTLGTKYQFWSFSIKSGDDGGVLPGGGGPLYEGIPYAWP
jgi:hypothetical protein